MISKRNYAAVAVIFALSLCARVDAADLLVASDGSSSPNGILRYDGNTGAFVGRFINIDRPISMTYGPDGSLYVGSISSNTINRYNGVTGAFLNTFASGGGLTPPWDIAFGPDGNLYAATDGPTPGVLRFNGTTGAFIDRFTTIAAHGLTFGPDGNLYVSTNGSVARYSGANGASMGDFVPADNSTIYGPYHLKFGPDGNLYVANVLPGIRKYDGNTGAFLGNFAVPPAPPGSPLFLGFELVFGPDGNLYVDNGEGSGVMRFNGTSGAFIDQFVPLGSGGLGVGRSMVFMVPEPASILWGMLGALILCRRR